MTSYFLIGSVTVVLLVFQITEKVSGIICHCDFCTGSVPNNTCRTDGYCLSLTWLQTETHVVHHAYRCLDRRMYFPRQVPTQCSIAANRNVSVVTACCKTDMCNLNLNPVLTVNNSRPGALPPIDELAFANLARRRHRKSTTPQPEDT